MPGSSASPERPGSPGRGGGWVVAQALLLAAVVVAGLVGPAWDRAVLWLAVPAGAVLVAAGVALAAAGMRGLGPSLSPFPRPRGDGSLVAHGVYGRVRHPIYGGLMLAATGWALLTASIAALVLAAVLVSFLVLKARREEDLLGRRFPEYAEYRRRVRRRFLPGIGRSQGAREPSGG
jgi:protein-S-isoprenylcysteine O-methyltransferase Ste14